MSMASYDWPLPNLLRPWQVSGAWVPWTLAGIRGLGALDVGRYRGLGALDLGRYRGLGALDPGRYRGLGATVRSAVLDL